MKVPKLVGFNFFGSGHNYEMSLNNDDFVYRLSPLFLFSSPVFMIEIRNILWKRFSVMAFVQKPFL